MKAKRTSEGYIFSCESEGEVGVVKCFAGEGGDFGKVVLDRLVAGGGAWCVFSAEMPEFDTLLAMVEDQQLLARGPFEDMFQDILNKMREAVARGGNSE